MKYNTKKKPEIKIARVKLGYKLQKHREKAKETKTNLSMKSGKSRWEIICMEKGSNDYTVDSINACLLPLNLELSITPKK